MNTFTVTAENSLHLADMINDAYRADNSTTVNNLPLAPRAGTKVANSWGNGTVSVIVPSRAVKGKFNDVFFKVGSTVTFTPAAR